MHRYKKKTLKPQQSFEHFVILAVGTVFTWPFSLQNKSEHEIEELSSYLLFSYNGDSVDYGVAVSGSGSRVLGYLSRKIRFEK